MNALTLQYVLLAIVAGLVLFALLPPLIRTYRRFRGKRLVICPETRQPVAVDVDATHAALGAMREPGWPHLRLTTCTRWPERSDCGQECVTQIEEAPEDCLVQSVIATWYMDRSCVLCGRPLGEFHWYEHFPAALGPEDKSLEWTSLEPERIPEVLATHRPICWNCHIVETFRREHPELVTDRPQR